MMRMQGARKPGEYASARSRWVVSGLVGAISSLPGRPLEWKRRASSSVTRLSWSAIRFLLDDPRTGLSGDGGQSVVRGPCPATSAEEPDGLEKPCYVRLDGSIVNWPRNPLVFA